MRGRIVQQLLSYAIADCPVFGNDVMVHSLDLRTPSMIKNLSSGMQVEFELDHYLASGSRWRAKDIAILIQLAGARQHDWSETPCEAQ
jgi:hypothetical protein